MKLLRNLFILLTFVVVTSAWGDWKIQQEYWYSVTIDDTKSGWAKEMLEVDGDLMKTTTIQEMSISRGGIVITISVLSEFVETRDGKPIYVKSIQEAMGQKSETTLVFKEDTIEMTSVAGGDPIVKILPRPDATILTPRAVNRLFVQKVSEGASVITYQTIASEFGAKAITIVMTKTGEEERDVLGKKTLVSMWTTENNVMPIIGSEVYTNEGVRVRSSVDAGFGDIINTLTTKHEAMSPINEIPELMVSLFVEPNKPIPDDPQLKRLTLQIKSKDGSVLDLPTSGAQRATSNADGTVTLEIDLDAPVDATPEELEDPVYLSVSSICDGSDEAVASIAREALKKLPSDASTMDKALALRAKVYDFIEDKSMSTAFASASQTARDKKGDCSEHGVLLCGLLRSAGIPSRAVLGMVYIRRYRDAPNGIFGWHMWSQALIDGKWIDLDATLRTTYSVGHVATTMTTLADESLASEMVSIISTIGNLDVEVISIADVAP